MYVCSNGQGTNHKVTKEVGLPLCEAFQAYNSGQFEAAVDLLAPLRYSIVTIGGSNAQVRQSSGDSNDE